MSIPEEVQQAIAGLPAIGAWNPMFSFLTIDAGGFPHVCLLSRAELDTDGEHVFAVLASRGSIGNIERTETATLMVVGEETALYLKLRVHKRFEEDDRRGFVLVPDSIKRDTLHTPLRSPGYLATEAVAASEKWDRTARLLARMIAVLEV
ncbi:hypothetical protein APR12_005549 [Nocardia amikacinitolerans]|uniref:hypothetical protein n=1 Tax=Nocardia amikacinitolerans TaxID=756689 RepID=UPI000832E8A6|nr:hypothetical protein [Nocardia amikacinitolerans]MCP2320168.1 hypothetical protein [Nocardia amikacinitolerans]